MSSQPNLAHILKSAGYKVVWKGKWHLSLPINGTNHWGADDISYMRDAYGFDGWNPNDAGTSVSDYSTLGGGSKYNNDARYVEGICLPDDQDSPIAESALEFLANHKSEEGPFCLVVSVVNPHDVWVAPGFSADSRYTEDMGSEYGLPVPQNVDESLSGKPTVQGIFREAYNLQTIQQFGLDKSLKSVENQQNYVSFYAYLQTIADQHITGVLDQLDALNLTDSTLIVRTSDHGEQAMAHGLREKMYQAYDETIHVPLIFSNPKMFPQAIETDAMASAVDILPTLAKVAGVYDQYQYTFKGKDLSPVLRDTQKSVQEYVHFTFDDGFLPGDIAMYIRAIRSKQWLYAVYFNDDASSFEYEMYNLKNDPKQNQNLAGLEAHSEQMAYLHNCLNHHILEAQTTPSGIPIITKALMAEQQETNTQLIPDIHWPTVEEALNQSADQRNQQKPDVKAMAKHIVEQSFWIAAG